ncbi:MAG TPA: hypothetical protein PK453_24550 [Leptospiraceae bacterium]|nr:hypothetical protein [Leptospiraceae bacterium]HNF16848.1 hypothetical protein [Leptospiraceae bacterium]HNM06859.1 hypothetical protein [Leptospiraceae bacterium]
MFSKKIIIFLIFFHCSLIRNSFDVKKDGQILQKSREGNFSFEIKTPDDILIKNFRLAIGRRKPQPVTEYYYYPSEGATDSISLAASFFFINRVQALPLIPDPDFIFISDIRTNEEYSFTLDEGAYYISADTMANADISFSPAEPLEFIFTFGYFHEYPHKRVVDVTEFTESHCKSFDIIDGNISRRKYTDTAGAYCPKVEIKKGKKIKFTFSGTESKIRFKSFLVKPFFFWLLFPFTNGGGYYFYRYYEARMDEMQH